jgi:cupin 2 domain-containing protein
VGQLTGDLLADLPTGDREASDEVLDTVLERNGWRLERIVSYGHTTPAGDWYDQGWDEWVLVVRGGARLQLADDPGHEVTLQPGQWMFLPKGCRHRVSWTVPSEPTVWLALHTPA